MSGFLPIDPTQLDAPPAAGGGEQGAPPWEVVLPEGTHHLRVREARLHESRAGNTSVFVRLEGRTENGARAWVDAYLSPSSRGLVHALRALQLAEDVRAAGGVSDDILERAVHRWVQVTTGVEPAQNGYPESTRVRYWEGPGQPQDWASAPAQQPAAPPPPPPAAAKKPAADPLVEKIRALPPSHRADDKGKTGAPPERTAQYWDGSAWREVPADTADRLAGFEPDEIPF